MPALKTIDHFLQLGTMQRFFEGHIILLIHNCSYIRVLFYTLHIKKPAAHYGAAGLNGSEKNGCYGCTRTSTRRSWALLPLSPVVSFGLTNSTFSAGTPCAIKKSRTDLARFLESSALSSALPVGSL